MFAADLFSQARHGQTVLSSAELIAALERLKDEGVTTNADLGRILDLPSSRIAEMFDGKRRVQIDEMKALVEHFGLEPRLPESPVPSARAMTPILSAVLKRAPKGDLSDRDVQRLAEALEYGLGLVRADRASEATLDALAVAARAAADRFREERPSA